MTISLAAKDEKTISMSFPVKSDDLAQLATIIGDAGNDGYELTNATTIQSGHQRDPYTSGVRLTLTRKP